MAKEKADENISLDIPPWLLLQKLYSLLANDEQLCGQVMAIVEDIVEDVLDSTYASLMLEGDESEWQLTPDDISASIDSAKEYFYNHYG